MKKNLCLVHFLVSLSNAAVELNQVNEQLCYFSINSVITEEPSNISLSTLSPCLSIFHFSLNSLNFPIPRNNDQVQ